MGDFLIFGSSFMLSPHGIPLKLLSVETRTFFVRKSSRLPINWLSRIVNHLVLFVLSLNIYCLCKYHCKIDNEIRNSKLYHEIIKKGKKCGSSDKKSTCTFWLKLTNHIFFSNSINKHEFSILAILNHPICWIH